MISIFLYVLYVLMSIFDIIIFASIIMTWIPNAFQHRFPILIRKIADWYMAPFRGWLVIGFLDLTPIIGLLLYNYIMSVVMAL